MVAYLCMMQQNIDVIGSLGGYTRRALCHLSVCSDTLKSFSMYFSGGSVHAWNDAVVEVATEKQILLYLTETYVFRLSLDCYS